MYVFLNLYFTKKKIIIDWYCRLKNAYQVFLKPFNLKKRVKSWKGVSFHLTFLGKYFSFLGQRDGWNDYPNRGGGEKGETPGPESSGNWYFSGSSGNKLLFFYYWRTWELRKWILSASRTLGTHENVMFGKKNLVAQEVVIFCKLESGSSGYCFFLNQNPGTVHS